MDVDQAIRTAESKLFSFYDLTMEESCLELPSGRVRVLSTGAGPAVVLLHGVSLTGVAWAPLLPALAGYRIHLVDLPGHGLSSPATYRPDTVRGSAIAFVDDLLDALDLAAAPVIGHSLGGMFALWYASERPERIASLVAIGSPAVALPGAVVRMPLSLMTLRALGPLFLRTPSPRPVFRYLLAQGLSPAAAAVAPPALLDALRLSVRRPGNAESGASLMHALNHFRRPRASSVLTDTELHRITTPTMFVWGEGDPFLSPTMARPSIAELPRAALHPVPGGHGPWFEDPDGCAELITQHLAATGFPPALPGPTRAPTPPASCRTTR
jgi:pimeloyl-ACP methyl ester carboxylesterase